MYTHNSVVVVVIRFFSKNIGTWTILVQCAWNEHRKLSSFWNVMEWLSQCCLTGLKLRPNEWEKESEREHTGAQCAHVYVYAVCACLLRTWFRLFRLFIAMIKWVSVCIHTAMSMRIVRTFTCIPVYMPMLFMSFVSSSMYACARDFYSDNKHTKSAGKRENVR